MVGGGHRFNSGSPTCEYGQQASFWQISNINYRHMCYNKKLEWSIIHMFYQLKDRIFMPPPCQTGRHPLPGQTGRHPLPGQTGRHTLPGQTGRHPLPGQTGRHRHCVHLLICSSVAKLLNMIFWKWTYFEAHWYNSSMEQGHKMINFWNQGIKQGVHNKVYAEDKLMQVLLSKVMIEWRSTRRTTERLVSANMQPSFACIIWHNSTI